ncbi:MAG TPA: hypothetical protein VFS33_02600 [Gemmatimonadales bacterium]|nr:hypothetical protein [Gemmatimonadales bacterium]
MSLIRLSRGALAVVLVAAPPATLAAQELDPHLYPKFELTASGSLNLFSTVVRADPTSRPGLGTEISFENDLGSSRDNFEPRGTLRWRPGRRHELEIGFLRAVRSSDRVLDRTLNFRDTSFAVGAATSSSLRTSQAFLNYRYAFRVRPNSQIGATLGVGVIFLKASLNATTTLGGTTTGDSATSKLNGPVASLGLYGRFRAGERWYLEADGRGVYIAISNFTGTVVEGGLAARRFLSNSFGLEFGWNIGFYKVTFDRPATGSGFLGSGFAGSVKYTVNTFRAGLVFQP